MSTLQATLVTTEPVAQALAEALGELFDPEEVAVSAFEIASLEAAAAGKPTVAPGREGAMGTLHPAANEPWRLEIHFSEDIDAEALRALVAEIAGESVAKGLAITAIEQQDWVSASLEGLKPVEAARFLVHGAHDRGRVASNRIGIEIEAALAFGTGHHGTTRGCLLHFDAVLKRRRPREIVDIGTGTAVLAIGAAKVLKAFIHAGEIDPDSVTVARENARLNGVGPFLRPVKAAGLQHPALRGQGRYDLVFANILARPLRGIAREVAQATAQEGELILSGLLPGDVRGVLSRYGAFGFCLVARRDIEGWVSLTLKRGGAKPRRR